jgi:hypothetical protein
VNENQICGALAFQSACCLYDLLCHCVTVCCEPVGHYHRILRQSPQLEVDSRYHRIKELINVYSLLNDVVLRFSLLEKLILDTIK